MDVLAFSGDFSSWKQVARSALFRGLRPERILWQPRAAPQGNLPIFNEEKPLEDFSSPAEQSAFRVPREFLATARIVACHRDESRWSLLYRVLWRLTHGETHLLNMSVDADVIELNHRAKAIRRDVHKMRAFVRFREVSLSGETWFVAWFEPHHCIVELNAPFFVERFASMNWSILTPERCAHWDKKSLAFTKGVSRDQAPTDDATEELWRTYYRSIFNPARVKVAAMKKEMPVSYWKNLPEAALIANLLAEAPLRAATMVSTSEANTVAANTFTPLVMPVAADWESTRNAAAQCKACPLWRNATCMVFGEGPRPARILIVGEQPGDQEDRAGKPFVGPAGELLDRALSAADVDRAQLYVTNAVKHFKWEPRGKRRIHQKPNSREIAACRPWLQKEIQLVEPDLILCLGATAALSVIGAGIKVTEARGQTRPTEFGIPALVTVHPSSLLRQPDRSREAEDFAAFVQDLKRLHDPSPS